MATVVDVMTKCIGWMADVTAIVTDGIATQDGMFLIMVGVIAFMADGMATESIVLFNLFVWFYF